MGETLISLEDLVQQRRPSPTDTVIDTNVWLRPAELFLLGRNMIDYIDRYDPVDIDEIGLCRDHMQSMLHLAEQPNVYVTLGVYTELQTHSLIFDASFVRTNSRRQLNFVDSVARDLFRDYRSDVHSLCHALNPHVIRPKDRDFLDHIRSLLPPTKPLVAGETEPPNSTTDRGLVATVVYHATIENTPVRLVSHDGDIPYLLKTLGAEHPECFVEGLPPITVYAVEPLESAYKPVWSIAS